MMVQFVFSSYSVHIHFVFSLLFKNLFIFLTTFFSGIIVPSKYDSNVLNFIFICCAKVCIVYWDLLIADLISS